DVSLDEYERRTDNFNVHVYELPLEPHETCIGAITSEIIEQCLPVKRTNAGTRADRSGKEADASFRPMKPGLPLQTETGNPLNILQRTCLIKINLDCLYYQAHPEVQLSRTILPDPIILDFFFVRNEILRAYRE
ncbi:5365_t:CDS:2, partial [Racocetra fulgida]